MSKSSKAHFTSEEERGPQAGRIWARPGSGKRENKKDKEEEEMLIER